MKEPFFAISRHRLVVDGAGVTTLVCFHGCPLRCKYCINQQCWNADGIWRTMDEAELLAETMVDDLYFKATGGGICFGGGEPLLRSAFIAAFCRQCPQEWCINLETSLHVPLHHLEQVASWVHHYFVDVKDMDADVYQRYTGADNQQVQENLRWLAQQHKQSQVTIRLPLIKGYNTESHRDSSQQQLEEMGFHDIERFDYIIPNNTTGL